jgi:hypothetical protein
LIRVVVGKAQAATDVPGHGDADVHVTVEADAIAGFGSGAECGRFADVVEERSPGECWRGFGGEILKHELGVDPDVALGMILGRLGDVFHGGDFREDLREQVERVEKFERAAGSALSEETSEFLANAFSGDDIDFVGLLADGGEGGGFDGVTETCGEADGAEHAEFVFRETPHGIADGADDSRGEVGAAADEVENFTRVVAHEESIDGEIAALDVFSRSLGVDDLIGVPAVGIAHVGAEGSDFYFEGIFVEENNAEVCADVDGVWEEAEDFGRRGVGRDVVIGGLAIKKNVAHATSDEEGLVALALERVGDRVGEIAGIHGMIMRQKARSNEVKK